MQTTTNGNAARVLVADDEPVIRDLVRASLEAAGHVVVTAPDGMEAFDRAIAISGYSEFYLRRGSSKHRLGRPEDAVVDYDQALELSPDAPLILQHRGHAYNELELRNKTAADFEIALQLDPFNPRIALSRAYQLWNKGNIRDAAEALDQAVVHGVYDGEIRAARGELYLTELYDYEESIDDLRAAVVLQPDVALNWYYLAQANAGLGVLHGVKWECGPEAETHLAAEAAIKKYRAMCRWNRACKRENLAAVGEIAALRESILAGSPCTI